MGWGTVSVRLLAGLVALAAWTASGSALPAGLEDPLLGSEAPAGVPAKASALPGAATTAAAPLPVSKGPDLAALLGDAVGALGAGLAGVAGALGSAAGALLGGLAALLGAMAQALLQLGLVLAGALGALLGLLLGGLGALLAGLASLLGGGAAAVARDPRLLAPVAGAGALGGAAWAWKLGKFAPLAALFSRIPPHELLANGARQRIFDLVRENPGAHVSQVAHATGLGWGTTVYHLGRLREARVLTARRVGNQLCHFVNGDLPSPEAQRMLAALKAPKAQAIVDLLRLRGPMTQQALARDLGLSSALLSWHAKRLEALGVVERARTGRTCTLVLRSPAAEPRPAPRTPMPVPA